MRPAFTLIEVLVSLMIFSIIGLVMIATLRSGTEVFRLGEYARAADDEAMAVLGAIGDDLDRVVPESQGGFCFADLRHAQGDVRDGSSVLVFKIRNPDLAQIAANGENRHLLVCWQVLKNGDLTRSQMVAADSNGSANPDESTLVASLSDASGTTIARGCLYFGTAMDTDAQGRLLDAERPWSRGVDHAALLPSRAAEFMSSPLPPARRGANAVPMPRSMQVCLTLSGGGRYAPRGILAEELMPDGYAFRVSSASGLGPGPGWLRIDVDPEEGICEWIYYETYRSGLVTVAKNEQGQYLRAARQSSDPGMRVAPWKNYPRGTRLSAGRSISLVRSFPH